MKKIYKLLPLLIMAVSVISCVKYEKDIDLDLTLVKQSQLTARIRSQIGDAPNGWLLMIPNPDPSIKTAIPIILKFDTVKNTFTSRSMFPSSTVATPPVYELSSATGAPLLSFASGSTFSAIYESGFIQDFYFKIMDVTPDSITMQPYRKGEIYASEGGTVMKMYKLKSPVTWFDTQYPLLALFSASNSPFVISATNPLKLTYKDGYQAPAWNMEFSGVGAGNTSFFKANIGISRDVGLNPIALYSNSDYSNYAFYYVSGTAMVTAVIKGWSPPGPFSLEPMKFINAIKTDYLLVRSISPDYTKIELFALNRYGQEVITGTLEVEQ
ncbi:hypothetical protein ECE50_012660 [Chitinophaga sp. Mgbs1]|uniref:Uncharacterized protein n=1 Tax=Chitinophaga solisilvae TaxID=1233460 RepID=A0A433WLY7_9BACT|nr:hypothetical protein [Chitinophaga solisilvae]